MTDPLPFVASIAEVIGIAQQAAASLADFENVQPDLSFKGEFRTLTSFLADIKNTFLNAREEPPATAQYALYNCHTSLKAIEKALPRNYGRDLKADKWRKQMYRDRVKLMENKYSSFRDSVHILKDVCSL